MLFLQPAVSKNRFISGLFAAASDDLRATYAPLKSNGAPTTARAGIAFPENDWVTFPTGDQYLANIPASPQLLSELAALLCRQRMAFSGGATNKNSLHTHPSQMLRLTFHDGQVESAVEMKRRVDGGNQSRPGLVRAKLWHKLDQS